MLALLKTIALSAALAANDTTELKPDSLIKVLKKGGYTILLRHTRTDMTSVDDVPINYGDRTAQRNLSGLGVADAKTIGRVMKATGIPLGEVFSSPMFRTVETAQMAFGEPKTTTLLRDMNESPPQRELFMRPVPAGTNRALVTHHFLIEHYIPGIRPGEIGESEAVVFKVADGKIVRVGRFRLADWAKLPGGAPTGAPVLAGHGAPGNYLRPPEGASADLKPFVWTQTPATKVAGLYLHTFNTGDHAQMHGFIEKSLVADPARPMEARIATYLQLFGEHGVLNVVGTASASASEAAIRVKSKRGEFDLVVTLSPTDSTRATSIRFVGRQGGP
jgi:phosphohistidine phosphatase SixA